MSLATDMSFNIDTYIHDQHARIIIMGSPDRLYIQLITGKNVYAKVTTLKEIINSSRISSTVGDKIENRHSIYFSNDNILEYTKVRDYTILEKVAFNSNSNPGHVQSQMPAAQFNVRIWSEVGQTPDLIIKFNMDNIVDCPKILFIDGDDMNES